MKKRGFTLIETLGAIVLLGILAAIVITVTDNVIDGSKESLYEEQIGQIKTGLKNLAHANIFLMPENGDSITVTLGQLKQMGYANYEIKNPKNNECFSNENLLMISRNKNNYKYDVSDIVDVDCDLTKDVPSIKLNGNFVEYLEIGETYTDPGVSALSDSKEDISDSVSVTITGDGSSINTSIESKYTITYSVTDNGKTMKAIRTVFVK